MRAVVLTKHGAPEALQVQNRPDPGPPAPDEVTVKVEAAGIAFAEIATRLGVYPPAPKLPTVLGFDIAGTVVAAGRDVTGLAVGDRVFGVTKYGGYAEYTNTLADNLRRLPPALSFAQGAAIPVNYGTAWTALISYGSIQLRHRTRVLIHAAAGGVGIAATQIAHRYGAEIWGTASPSKHDALRAFGVDHPVDYRNPGWEKNLPSFDVVLDPIGGRNLRTSYRLLHAGGRVITYGASTAVAGGRRSIPGLLLALIRMPRVNPMKLMFDSKSVMGLFMTALWDQHGSYGPVLDPLLELIDDGTIAPAIDSSFDFRHAPDAHRRLAERNNIGKVVLVPTKS
jgi:NADPH:quinone reductase-like Zn-dependent oxidoreductase